MIDNVFKFNETIVKIPRRDLAPLGRDEKQWLCNALREEALELEDSETLPDQVDALLDSVIFALGGLYRLGLTEDQARACFDAIMLANFTKTPGKKESRAVGDVADAVKPEDFVDPKLAINTILCMGVRK